MSGPSSIDSLRRLSAVSDLEAAAVYGASGCDELLADVTRQPFGRGARLRTATHRRRRHLVLVA